MVGKGKKKKSKANKNANANKGAKSTGKTRKTGRRVKSSRCTVDVFNEVAMNNAYVTCHNVQDLLFRRGFPWPELQKKKKKGKK